MVKETAFYELLGVAPSASADEIRRSYKRLALKFHPDKNKDPGAQDKFKAISRAYEVLSDDEKRQRYDRFGEKGIDNDREPQDPTDIFSAMFGGGGGGQRREPKPKPIVHELPITLEHMYRGRTAKLAITRDRLCSKCDGRGSNKPGVNAKCGACDGEGVQVVTRQVGPGMLQRMRMPCSACGGKGTNLRPEDRCDGCRGEQIVKDKKIFEVAIERGTRKGDHVTFSGEGDQVAGVRLAGDIVIVFDEKPHAVFTRKGHHLVVERAISLAEALTGFRCVVPHLDDRTLCIAPEAGAVLDPDRLYEVSREGMPVPKTGGVERGNLYVKFKVQYPSHVSADDLAVLRKVLGCPPAPVVPDGAEECTLRVATGEPQEEKRRDDDDGADGPQMRQGAQCTQQ